jgi:hypothetical protein
MERLTPPDAIAAYFDAAGTYYLLLQTFTETDGWMPAKGCDLGSPDHQGHVLRAGRPGRDRSTGDRALRPGPRRPR